MAQPPATRLQPTSTLGNRYQLLEPLGAGGMGTVFHALDRLTGAPVALKRVLPAPLQPVSAELRLALAREFRALATLRHPHVIEVLDYGFDSQQRPYFTMELLRDAQPITADSQFLPLEQKIGRLLQLLQALVYIHRRGIIHRDLKPGNVLVQNETVKLLDFGLAIIGDTSVVPSGTLAYMAPELLQGQPPSVGSDLYAVGVIAYELFAGWHPFTQPTVQQLPARRYEPDFAYLELEDALIAVLKTLLAPDPAGRFSSASDAITALCRAAARPLPPETAIGRESFLQAAPFIGRSTELERLAQALSRASTGSGSAWLVRGESGIGKTRLLQELRTQALVQGAAVLSSSGRSDGGAYHVWRQILRPLLLLAPPDDLGAAVLLPVVPDIELLLGRVVPPAPPIDARAAQMRLHLTVVDLVRSAAQRQPLLLFFEDLHWSDEPGLVLLQALVQSLPDLSLLLVASCRPGERPLLSQQLVGFTDLPLTRLATAQVADLCSAVLGEHGARAHLINFLHRETEGNTFFIIELMRTLAEEAGRLDQIGEMALPPTLTAGGMQRMVQRRLQRIPAVHQPLLQSAAVAGRRVDTALLAYLHPAAVLEEWLTDCANAAILERPEGGLQWQFSHDKLRDGLLAELSPADQQRAHLAIARGLEHVYAATLAEKVEALAHHYGRAGATAEQKKYLRLSAERAESGYAHESALSAYEKLLPLLEDSAEQAVVRLQIGRILKLTGQWDAAYDCLTAALAQTETAGSPAGDAGSIDVSALEAQLLLVLGSLARSRSHLSDALTWLERARTRFEALGDAVGRCTTLVEIGNIYYQQGEYETAQREMAAALLVAETAADPRSLALAQHNLGSVAYAQSDYATARTHYEAALALRQTLGYKPETADSFNNLGLIAYRQGAFGRAVMLLEQSLTLRRQAGDAWGIAASLNNLGMIAYQQRDFKAANGRWREVLLIRERLGDSWGIAGALDNLGLVEMTAGETENAAQLISRAIAIRRELGDTHGLAISLGNRARLMLQEGDFETAYADYSESLRLSLEIGDQLGAVFSLTGMAAVWAEWEQMENAVSLLGAAAAQLTRINGRWETDEKEIFDRTNQRARGLLAPDVYAAAWEKGNRLTPSTAAEVVEEEDGTLVS